MTQYTLANPEGRYEFISPEDGVTLADLGASIYPASDYAVVEDGRVIPRITVRPRWDEEFDASEPLSGRGDAPVGSVSYARFADLARGIGPVPDFATLDDSGPPYMDAASVSGGDDLPGVRVGRDDDVPELPIYRGGILPISKDARGNVYFDSDSGIFGAIKRGLTLAGDVASGRIPMQTEDGRHNPEVIERALDMASLGGLGSLRTAAMRGSAPKLERQPTESAVKLPSTQLSVQRAAANSDARASIYDFPAKPELPLRDYYGLSPINTNKAGRLLQTPEGYTLKPNVPTAGYTTLAGQQQALSPGQIEQLIRQITKRPPESVADSHLQGALGAYSPLFQRVLYRNSLEPAMKNRVLSHELGHVFHDFTPKMLGEIMKSGRYAEFNKVHSRGRFGIDVDPPLSPWYVGYSYKQFPTEWAAELIRAYLTNPNYAKVEAPNAAALLRRLVNNNPKLSKFIQLNSGAPWPVLLSPGERPDSGAADSRTYP